MNDIPLLKLDVSQLRAVTKKMSIAQKESFYVYPWKTLERDLKKRRISKLPLIVYGSMINIRSSAQTLSKKSITGRKPIIAFGVRRIFNYEMPANTARYRISTNPIERAALNVRLTGEIKDVVNGVLLNISLKDIPNTRARELDYDLIPVACLYWKDLSIHPFIAYILRCPNTLQDGRKGTNDKIEPNPDYYLICRKGAADFGKKFLLFWLATTFLANGKTSVQHWESKILPKNIIEGK